MSEVRQPQRPADPKSARRWTGSAIVLVSIGLLILVPSGLCTGVFGVFGLGALFDGGGPQASGYGGFALGMALIVGGPFIVLGALLVRTGLRERHRG